jgi:hypothetical protein
MDYEKVRAVRSFKYGDSEIPFTDQDAKEVIKAFEASLILFDKLEELDGEGFEFTFEEKIDCSSIGISHGTADIVGRKDDILLIADYKFGEKEVSPYSEQLKSYAGCWMEDNLLEGINHVYLSIIQPKRSDLPVTCKMSASIVNRHIDMMKEIIALAKSGHAPRNPNSYCRYCARYARCTAAQAIESKAVELKNGSFDIASMTNEELGTIIARLNGFDKVVGSLKREAMARMINGIEIPNLTIGEGRASRVWTDERDAEKKLRELCKEHGVSEELLYETKFVSPAKAGKLFDAKTRKEFGSLIMKRAGKPALKITTEV